MMILAAVFGLLAVAGTAAHADAIVKKYKCPRCSRMSTWFAKCKECGTVYCFACSSEAEHEIGKLKKFVCRLQCPVCKSKKCMKLELKKNQVNGKITLEEPFDLFDD